MYTPRSNAAPVARRVLSACLQSFTVQSTSKSFIPSHVSVTVHDPSSDIPSEVQVSLESTRHLHLEDMQKFNPVWRDPKTMLRPGKPVILVHGDSKEKHIPAVTCISAGCFEQSLSTCQYNRCPKHCIAARCACRLVSNRASPILSPSAIDTLLSETEADPPLQTCMSPSEVSSSHELKYAGMLKSDMSMVSLWHLADAQLLFIPPINDITGSLEVDHLLTLLGVLCKWGIYVLSFTEIGLISPLKPLIALMEGIS